MKRSPHICLIAGEASGDSLGAGLMSALKQQDPDIRFTGVGGKKMMAEGLQSLFPMEELSVMGVAEILPRLYRIWRRLRETTAHVLSSKPDVLITIDSPDFCFRVAARVKKKDKSIPCIHYVAPSVWAWRPGRAKKIAGFLDHLLTLLPFEPPYFTEHGLAATFIGHPVVERVSNRGDGKRFRQKHGLKDTQPILTMLPGSRMSELDRLLDKFSETADNVLQKKHDAVIVIPTLRHLKPYIEKFFVGRGINPIVVDTEDEKFDAFAASMAAIAASGTVSLELALTDTPHIIAYKLSPFSAWLARYLVKVKHVNLINILQNREVVPELLLENCEPAPMSAALSKLVNETDARIRQLAAFRDSLIKLGMGDVETPSQKAARTVWRLLEKRNGGG